MSKYYYYLLALYTSLPIFAYLLVNEKHIGDKLLKMHCSTNCTVFLLIHHDF